MTDIDRFKIVVGGFTNLVNAINNITQECNTPAELLSKTGYQLTEEAIKDLEVGLKDIRGDWERWISCEKKQQ